MQKMLLILSVVIFSITIFAQQDHEGISVNSGNIYTTNSEIIKAQYIVFSKDSIEFYLENSQDRYVLPLEQVNEVQEYDGNYGSTGMWIGGFAGIAIGTVVALGTKETTTTGFIEETTIQTWPILVFTLAGTLIGYVIGAQAEDWNTVYSKNSGFLKNFNIKQNKQNEFALSYRVYF